MTDKTKIDEPKFDDLNEFSRNFTTYLEISSEIAQMQMDKLSKTEAPSTPSTDPLNIMPTMAHFTGYFLAHPQETMELGMKFWADQIAIWNDASAKIAGGDAAKEAQALPDLPAEGRRFSHPEWSENAMLEYVKRSYLLTAQWAGELVETAAPDLSPREYRKIDLMMRNLVDASNPANFAALNPEVLETTRLENGANLVRGAQMMLEDMARGQGELLVRQTDLSAFEVGRDMAVTPGKVIFENEIFQLIQYAPTTKKVNELPLLMIPPWINKFYVLDLNKKKSLMKWLVAQGHTVFIVSWVNPDHRHGSLSWDDYMMKGALCAVDKVLEETGARSTNVASYCIGGTLTGTLLARLSKMGDTRVASTTFFTAQLDYQDAGDLQAFVDEHTLTLIEASTADGFLPAQAMATAFNTLRSSDLIWSYVVANYLLGKEPFPFDLLYWNSDSTRMPGRVHRFYLEQFYVRNAFALGQLEIGDEMLSVADISGPIYHLATIEDHIAPAQSVYRGARMMDGADVTFVLAGSGHIAGVVNPVEPGKYQYWTNQSLDAETLEEWSAKADMTDGSWWPHWDKWLQGQSIKQVAARAPGKNLKPIEDAPGRYVKQRFDEP